MLRYDQFVAASGRHTYTEIRFEAQRYLLIYYINLMTFAKLCNLLDNQRIMQRQRFTPSQANHLFLEKQSSAYNKDLSLILKDTLNIKLVIISISLV
jgi:hypothetical protein